jgi:flagellar biosynthesis protein FliP
LANSFHFLSSSIAAFHLLLSSHLIVQLFPPSLLLSGLSLFLTFLLHFLYG